MNTQATTPDAAEAGAAYPRKWFRASKYGWPVEEREFIRETDKMLVYFRRGERREAKSDSYGRWYPKREEAEAALAAINARKDELARDRRIRDAAPDLLRVLQNMVHALDAARSGSADVLAPKIEVTRAAAVELIAKATGAA